MRPAPLALLLLLPALALAAPGSTARDPIDDRRIFAELDRKVGKLATEGKSPLPSKVRLEQGARRTTSAPRLLTPSRQPLSRESLRALAAASTVAIATSFKCDKCPNWHSSMASGVIVDPAGIVATNHHVACADKGEAMGVMLSDGTVLPVVEVLAGARGQDVALLRLDTGGRTLPALPVRGDLPAGAEIACYSNPDGSYGFFSQGIVSRYARSMNPADRGAVWMEVTCEYAKGSSGAPVLDLLGNVVGLVSSTRSIYYNTESDGDQRNFQMVRRHCVPAAALLDLVKPEAPAAK
jgi:S1-C subfamily serine protease